MFLIASLSLMRTGGILADDMGLGKTIQVIAFLAAIMEKRNDRRDIGRRAKFVAQRQQDDLGAGRGQVDVEAIKKWPTCLIAAPPTLVGNWERELETVRPPNAARHTTVTNDVTVGSLRVWHVHGPWT